MYGTHKMDLAPPRSGRLPGGDATYVAREGRGKGEKDMREREEERERNRDRNDGSSSYHVPNGYHVPDTLLLPYCLSLTPQ